MTTPLQAEIQDRFGVVPNFFGLAHEAPEIMANLWGFAKFGYLDNPLPPLFKERLFVSLSRFCAVRYCIARHVGFLVGWGRPSGDRHCSPELVDKVVQMIRRPLPQGDDLVPHLSLLDACQAPFQILPESDTPGEQAIFACATHVFLQTPPGADCLKALRRAFEPPMFQHLTVFLTFVRTAHYWTMVHPELAFEEDVEQLLETHEALAECVLKDPEATASVTTQGLLNDLAELRRESTLRVESAQRALRESEERLSLALSAAEMGTWRADLRARIGVRDGNSNRLLGFGEIGTSSPLEDFFARFHTDDRPRMVEAFEQAVQQRGPYDIEVRIRHQDGTVHWVREKGSLVYDSGDGPQFLTGVTMDITDRKRAEESLQLADRRKDEFLATLAHELRNPLAPLRNGLHLLKMTSETVVKDEVRGMMERQLEQMVRLVDDLMDISRVSRNKLELRKARIELGAVVQRAIEAASPQIEAHGHTLSVTLPPATIYLNGDLTRLAQVFCNLLNNSAKYTNTGGRISLVAELTGEQVVITVQDNGIGIPAEALPALFDIFSQVDSSLERAQGGLGIGLALVKGLTEAHGGTVEAYSQGACQGSRFVVRLPLAQRQPTVEKPRACDVATPSLQRRILIVDDNQDGAISLAKLLTVLGNETRIAHDGLAAVDVAESFRPNLIVLDVGLPKLNGYEVCRHIRGNAWGKNMVIVAATGWGQEEDRRRSEEAGFDHHLVKPVDVAQINRLQATGKR